MADRNATVAEGGLTSAADSSWMMDPDVQRGFIAQARFYAKSNVICARRVVGAVVVGRAYGWARSGVPVTLGVGWNGTPKGMTECDEGGCPRGMLTRLEFSGNNGAYDSGPGRCTGLHAETAAVLSYLGHVRGDIPDYRVAAMFCTHRPCWNCLVVAWGAAIPVIFYPNPETPEISDPVALLHGDGLE